MWTIEPCQYQKYSLVFQMMLQFFFPNPDIIIKNNQSLSSHSTVKNKKGGIDLKLVKEQNKGIIKHIYLGF